MPQITSSWELAPGGGSGRILGRLVNDGPQENLPDLGTPASGLPRPLSQPLPRWKASVIEAVPFWRLSLFAFLIFTHREQTRRVEAESSSWWWQVGGPCLGSEDSVFHLGRHLLCFYCQCFLGVGARYRLLACCCAVARTHGPRACGTSQVQREIRVKDAS